MRKKRQSDKCLVRIKLMKPGHANNLCNFDDVGGEKGSCQEATRMDLLSRINGHGLTAKLPEYCSE